jgi:hypothetical protein
MFARQLSKSVLQSKSKSMQRIGSFRAMSSRFKGLLKQDSPRGSATCAAGDSPSAAPPTAAANSADDSSDDSEELGKLREDVLRLNADNEQLNADNKQLNADNERLKDEVERLRGENKQLNERLQFDPRQAVSRWLSGAVPLITGTPASLAAMRSQGSRYLRLDQHLMDTESETAAANAIAAELARVKALPEQDRELVGKMFTDPEGLWAALEAGGGDATSILRASWFKTQRGARLPKRGDKLPPGATITVAELRAISLEMVLPLFLHENTFSKALPVIALSHYWRTKEHPDPDGETMELVISALELRWHEFEEMGVTDLGILIDWCALWQEPRTQAQSISFAIGLKGINLWYAHQGTTVWLVTEGADRVKGLTYWDKGWTSFEFALAMLIKPANSSRLKAWPQVVDLGEKGDAQTAFPRPALSEPLAFFAGHKFGDKTYTNGADRDAIVAPKFRETMFQVMGGVHKLNFGRLEWGHEGIKALTVVLPLCRQLRELWIGGNSFGDAGLITLVGTIWAIPQLEVSWRPTASFPCL